MVDDWRAGSAASSSRASMARAHRHAFRSATASRMRSRTPAISQPSMLRLLPPFHGKRMRLTDGALQRRAARPDSRRIVGQLARPGAAPGVEPGPTTEPLTRHPRKEKRGSDSVGRPADREDALDSCLPKAPAMSGNESRAGPGTRAGETGASPAEEAARGIGHPSPLTQVDRFDGGPWVGHWSGSKAQGPAEDQRLGRSPDGS